VLQSLLSSGPREGQAIPGQPNYTASLSLAKPMRRGGGFFGGGALTFSGPSSLSTTTSTGHERSRLTLDLHVGQALASRVNWRVGISNLGDAPLSRSRQYTSSGQQITDLSRTLTGPRIFASVGAQF